MSDEDTAQSVYDTDTPEKFRDLRANPKKRRGGYGLLIFLTLLVLVASIVDIYKLDSKLEFAILGLYVVLAVAAIIMFFSRRRAARLEAEQAPPIPQELQRALMQCPDCKSVFEFGEVRFHDHRRTAFSCPVCGVYSKLPDPDQEPVKVLRPEGEFKEVQYHCNNCGEDLAVGTFGETPLHLVRFRNCPSCGEKGHIVRTGVLPPTYLDDPDAGTAGV